MKRWSSALLVIAFSFLAETRGHDQAAVLTAHGGQTLDNKSAHTKDPLCSDQPPAELSALDWTSIQELHEQDRHAAVWVEGAYQAHNPGQQWQTRFDGRGFTVQPAGSDWQWGLELCSYGFADQQRVVAGPPRVSAEAERVAYDWGGGMREWFVNDRRGLEHGFTLQARPEGGGGRLLVKLGVRGKLRAEVEPSGKGVRFIDARGGAALTYAGLTVFDATGRRLPA